MDLKKINMGKIRDFIRTSPILFSLGFSLLAIVVHLGFPMLLRLLLPDNTWMGILEEVLCILWPVALAVLFGFGFTFRQRGIRAAVGAGLPVFLLLGLVLVCQLIVVGRDSATQWKSGLEIFWGILSLLGIGIREEVLFRGVNTNAVAFKYGSTTKGLWITVFSTSAMFGVLHLTNVLKGASFSGALVQAIGCIATGVLYCAVYLRSGSIWGVALLHSLWDAPSLAKTLFANVPENLPSISIISGYRMDLMTTMLIVFELLLAAFLLRKSKQQKIFDRLEQLKSSEMA